MKISELGDQWRKGYEYCIRKYSVKDAMVIAKFYKPSKLYKYFTFDEHWEDNIKNGTIVFNWASNFNDPQDSRWFIDFDKVRRKRFEEIGENWDDMKKKIPISLEIDEEDLLYLRDHCPISCFSETPCSNLMWGHYADKHKGFCIEYDTQKMAEVIKILMPVVYTERPFDASDILDLREGADLFSVFCPALIKSKDWSYEKEWRAFYIGAAEKGKIVLEYIPQAITGIFFGFYAYGEERKKAEIWAKDRGIKIYQMERLYCSYDFTYEEVDNISTNPKALFV